MKFGPVPVSQGEGKILAHNIARANGRRAFRKGKRISPQDVVDLTDAGWNTIYVAELETGDVDENSATRMIAEAAVGSGQPRGLTVAGHSEGRVNLVAQTAGVLKVDAARLDAVNEFEGVTFATLRSGSIVAAGQTVATMKVIPYGLPLEFLQRVVRSAGGGTSESDALVEVHGFHLKRVSLIYSGSAAARDFVIKTFEAPLRERIEAFEAKVTLSDYVCLDGENDEEALAEALLRQASQKVELMILAGETSTMDDNDILPRAVKLAGGRVVCVGAPVEPGNLTMLAYLGEIPVLGSPGCVRSPNPTLVDQILAALVAGERLTRADIVRMGHGGLLEGPGHGS